MEEIFIGCGSLYKNKIKEVTDLKDKPVITFTHFKELRDNIYAMTYKRCYFENFLTKIWLHTRA